MQPVPQGQVPRVQLESKAPVSHLPRRRWTRPPQMRPQSRQRHGRPRPPHPLPPCLLAPPTREYAPLVRAAPPPAPPRPPPRHSATAPSPLYTSPPSRALPAPDTRSSSCPPLGGDTAARAARPACGCPRLLPGRQGQHTDCRNRCLSSGPVAPLWGERTRWSGRRSRAWPARRVRRMRVGSSRQVRGTPKRSSSAPSRALEPPYSQRRKPANRLSASGDRIMKATPKSPAALASLCCGRACSSLSQRAGWRKRRTSLSSTARAVAGPTSGILATASCSISQRRRQKRSYAAALLDECRYRDAHFAVASSATVRLDHRAPAASTAPRARQSQRPRFQTPAGAATAAPTSQAVAIACGTRTSALERLQNTSIARRCAVRAAELRLTSGAALRALSGRELISSPP
eukprot:scaffold1365_cov121-Isochrysis_galbana.AAC.3